jgi:hypothetical protein
VNDVALRCLHQFGLRMRHCLQSCIAVAALDGFFDGADRATHLGAARLVDDGAAGNLAGRLFGGSGIGHVLNYPSADIALVVGLERAGRSNCVIDAGCISKVFLRMPCRESQMLPKRRCSKNSGGGIAPAAIGGLIEREFCTVNAFRTPEKTENPAGIDA